MDAGHRRIVRDGMVFRDHNDAIHDAIAAFEVLPDPARTHGFMCECVIVECDDTLELTTAQYREGRSDPAWSLVMPEHLLADTDRLVRDCGAYWIVAPQDSAR